MARMTAREHLIADREMRQLLAELELVAHGSTTAWNPSGGHDNDTHAFPPGEHAPPHLRYRRWYLSAPDDLSRDAVKAAARTALKQLRGYGAAVDRPAAETHEEMLARIVRDHEGWTPEDIAASLPVTAAQVRKARLAAQRYPETGTSMAGDLTTDEKRKRAREMRARNVPTRTIAEQLDVHQTQVMRWTRDQGRKAA